MKNVNDKKRTLLKTLAGKICELEEQIEHGLKKGMVISRDEMQDILDLSLADTQAFTSANLIRRKSNLLLKCKQAMLWILNGHSTKHCKNCGEEINQKRQLTIPTAQRCIACQMEYEEEKEREAKLSVFNNHIAQWV